MSLLRTIRLDYEHASGRRFGYVACMSYYYKKLGFRAVLWHRIANYLYTKGLPILPTVIMVRTWSKTGAEISPAAQIGPGFALAHPVGVVVGRRVVMGANCTILQGVTLGENYPTDSGHEYPTIEQGVTIGAGAKVLGGITIGSNTIIGANAVVRDDMPADSVVVGVPARVVKTLGEPRS